MWRSLIVVMLLGHFATSARCEDGGVVVSEYAVQIGLCTNATLAVQFERSYIGESAITVTRGELDELKRLCNLDNVMRGAADPLNTDRVVTALMAMETPPEYTFRTYSHLLLTLWDWDRRLAQAGVPEQRIKLLSSAWAENLAKFPSVDDNAYMSAYVARGGVGLDLWNKFLNGTVRDAFTLYSKAYASANKAAFMATPKFQLLLQSQNTMRGLMPNQRMRLFAGSALHHLELYTSPKDASHGLNNLGAIYKIAQFGPFDLGRNDLNVWNGFTQKAQLALLTPQISYSLAIVALEGR